MTTPQHPPQPLYAWHFSTGTLRFQYENVPVEAGLTLKTDDYPVPEKYGFHASVSPLDALKYFAVRPNDRIVISRVRLSGACVVDETHLGRRLVAQCREHLWTADAEPALENYAVALAHRAVAWLSIEGVIMPVQISDAILARRCW